MPSPWKKSSDQLRHIQRQKYYFANKDPSSQSYVFSKHEKYHEKIMYGCENWTMKTAENQRIDGFQL